MTVAELIAKLQELPQWAEVSVLVSYVGQSYVLPEHVHNNRRGDSVVLSEDDGIDE